MEHRIQNTEHRRLKVGMDPRLGHAGTGSEYRIQKHDAVVLLVLQASLLSVLGVIFFVL